MSRLRRALAAVLVGALVATGLTACGGDAPIRLTATFDDVGDLVVGHSVQMADVRVGRITRIELTEDFRAEVGFEIRGDLEVPRASSAVLRTTSLLGEKFIELRALGDPTEGPFLEDGDVVERAFEAPELEFVAEQAVNVLGAVVANDLRILVETGSVGFGGRGPELRALLDDLAVITDTLAERSGDIGRIIDRLDAAAGTLAGGSGDLDGLLVELARTTQLLADNRDRAITAVEALTRLARIQNEEVLGPHLSDLDRQLSQLDAILERVAGATGEVASLVDWLVLFVERLPLGVPGDFAQVYGWNVTDDEEGEDPVEVPLGGAGR